MFGPEIPGRMSLLFHYTRLAENIFFCLHVFALIVISLPFYLFLRCLELLLKILDYLYDQHLEISS